MADTSEATASITYLRHLVQTALERDHAVRVTLARPGMVRVRLLDGTYDVTITTRPGTAHQAPAGGGGG